MELRVQQLVLKIPYPNEKKIEKWENTAVLNLCFMATSESNGRENL